MNDTIVAIATKQYQSSIGIVKMSGEYAKEIGEKPWLTVEYKLISLVAKNKKPIFGDKIRLKR